MRLRHISSLTITSLLFFAMGSAAIGDVLVRTENLVDLQTAGWILSDGNLVLHRDGVKVATIVSGSVSFTADRKIFLTRGTITYHRVPPVGAELRATASVLNFNTSHGTSTVRGMLLVKHDYGRLQITSWGTRNGHTFTIGQRFGSDTILISGFPGTSRGLGTQVYLSSERVVEFRGLIRAINPATGEEVYAIKYDRAFEWENGETCDDIPCLFELNKRFDFSAMMPKPQ